MEPPYSSPRLPPELERVVFEMAALLWRTTIPNLMLVAWRVRNWYKKSYTQFILVISPVVHRMEPFLRVAILCDSQAHHICGFQTITSEILRRINETQPPGYLVNIVSHLFMEDDVNWSPTEVEIILMACNRVTTAFLAIPSCPLSAVATFYRLRRLAIPFMELQDLSESDRATVLHNITHLALLKSDGASSCRNPEAFLAMLPHLTHISFDWIGLIIKMCLALCASTQVHCIVCLCPRPFEMMQNRFQSLIHDSRFVCIDQQGNRREAWLRGIDGGQDYWTLAENFIVGRRAGRVNSSRYNILFDDDSWGR
ncbi:hypothetical protein B0H14DRAFT_2807886 [Mycena olivaceomarginata]|nr:hypothetical protein B0H14DRAFT_2807886 [Mycena olivaceomarginata]